MACHYMLHQPFLVSCSFATEPVRTLATQISNSTQSKLNEDSQRGFMHDRLLCNLS